MKTVPNIAGLKALAKKKGAETPPEFADTQPDTQADDPLLQQVRITNDLLGKLLACMQKAYPS